jgi:hypothetical protein
MYENWCGLTVARFSATPVALFVVGIFPFDPAGFPAVNVIGSPPVDCWLIGMALW